MTNPKNNFNDKFFEDGKNVDENENNFYSVNFCTSKDKTNKSAKNDLSYGSKKSKISIEGQKGAVKEDIVNGRTMNDQKDHVKYGEVCISKIVPSESILPLFDVSIDGGCSKRRKYNETVISFQDLQECDANHTPLDSKTCSDLVKKEKVVQTSDLQKVYHEFLSDEMNNNSLKFCRPNKRKYWLEKCKQKFEDSQRNKDEIRKQKSLDRNYSPMFTCFDLSPKRYCSPNPGKKESGNIQLNPDDRLSPNKFFYSSRLPCNKIVDRSSKQNYGQLNIKVDESKCKIGRYSDTHSTVFNDQKFKKQYPYRLIENNTLCFYPLNAQSDHYLPVNTHNKTENISLSIGSEVSEESLKNHYHNYENIRGTHDRVKYLDKYGKKNKELLLQNYISAKYPVIGDTFLLDGQNRQKDNLDTSSTFENQQFLSEKSFRKVFCLQTNKFSQE